MNLYKICLRVKKEIYFTSDIFYKNPKYVWVVSASLSNAVTYFEKLLKIEFGDYYFENVQLMGKARIDK